MGIMDVLYIMLVLLIFAIMVLLFVYWYMNRKSKMEEEKEQTKTGATVTKVAKEYTKKSIFNFMQFDKIEDNMIIQDNEKKFLMVIECAGINYDLMSKIEKTSVEACFVQFLNTLRYPVQLYTQTRTVDIAESLETYEKRLEKIEKDINDKKQEYRKIFEGENPNEVHAEVIRREVLRLENLYEYGKDIVADIQKTSQNKNVLRKHYYIVVPYHVSELGTEFLDKKEQNNLVFSELYTRSQVLIRTLFACGVKCKILNSNELVELLYVAYNRDEAESYGIEKAIKAGYTELYSTAEDVLDKKMKALDKAIEEKALEKARESINEARLAKEIKINRKEEEFEELVVQMAEKLLKQNEKYIGKSIAERAIKKIKGPKLEGGEKNEQKPKTRTRKNSSQ